MKDDFYCVVSLCAEDKYFPCYEQAVKYCKELAEETHSGNALYKGELLVGTCEWCGFVPLGDGGYVDNFQYSDFHKW